MPPLHGLKVIRSNIHGYGVIATRPYRTGEILVYGDGIVYSENDDFDDTYALLLHYPKRKKEPHLLLDLTDQTRWINHSCDPNTEVDAYWDPETGAAQCWWVALRDIPVGEELTYDYAFSPELAEPCTCGSEFCRGVIVDEDLIHKVGKKLKPLVRQPTMERIA